MNTTLLNAARAVRKQLLQSRLYAHASIRDAVELAADNMRQLADEADFERVYADHVPSFTA
jgi:hypothetical protein